MSSSRPVSLRAQLTLTMAGLALGVCAALAYFTFRAASGIIENDARRVVDTVAESQRTLLDHTLTAQFERLHSTVDDMARCSSEDCERASVERLRDREEPEAVRVVRRGIPTLELGTWTGLDPLPPAMPGAIARPFRDAVGKPHYVMTRATDETTLSVVWSATELEPLFSRVPALGESGETFLADPRGYFLTPPRYPSEMGRTRPISVTAMQRCLAGEDGTMEDLDYRGVLIIHGYRYVPQIGGGCVMAHIDLYEAEAPVRKLEREILVASIVAAILAIAIAAYSAKRLTSAIASLARYARRLRTGDLDAPVPRITGSREQLALAATLARMAKGLREGEQVRERFIGILAHDLQSPLSAIVLSSGLIARSAQSSDTHRLVTTISSNAKRMSRMITDLLDFARSRRPEGLPLRKGDVDLGSLAASAVDALREAHPKRAIDLVRDGDSRVCCDSDRALQVVTNLVENALRYGDEDRPITVYVRGVEDDVELSVHNWGPPIEAELVQNLFDPFRRGREAVQRSRAGLGLGLYVVDQVMRAHAGRVDVKSSEAHGTTFVTRWPRASRTMRP